MTAARSPTVPGRRRAGRGARHRAEALVDGVATDPGGRGVGRRGVRRRRTGRRRHHSCPVAGPAGAALRRGCCPTWPCPCPAGAQPGPADHPAAALGPREPGTVDEALSTARATTYPPERVRLSVMVVPTCRSGRGARGRRHARRSRPDRRRPGRRLPARPRWSPSRRMRVTWCPGRWPITDVWSVPEPARTGWWRWRRTCRPGCSRRCWRSCGTFPRRPSARQCWLPSPVLPAALRPAARAVARRHRDEAGRAGALAALARTCRRPPGWTRSSRPAATRPADGTAGARLGELRTRRLPAGRAVAVFVVAARALLNVEDRGWALARLVPYLPADARMQAIADRWHVSTTDDLVAVWHRTWRPDRWTTRWRWPCTATTSGSSGCCPSWHHTCRPGGSPLCSPRWTGSSTKSPRVGTGDPGPVSVRRPAAATLAQVRRIAEPEARAALITRAHDRWRADRTGPWPTTPVERCGTSPAPSAWPSLPHWPRCWPTSRAHPRCRPPPKRSALSGAVGRDGARNLRVPRPRAG